MNISYRICICLVFICFFASCSSPQKLQDQQLDNYTVDESVQYVRGLYFDRDFALAQKKGAQLIKQHTGSVELRAWHLASMAQSSKKEKAVDKAQQLVADYPDSPYSYFAAALTNSNVGKAVKASQAAGKALQMSPGHPDFLWMRARVFSDPHRAITFVDRVKNKLENPAPLLTVKGDGLADLSNDTTAKAREKLFNRALSTFENARDLAPSFFEAWYLPAYHLNRKGDDKQAIELYKKAISKTTAIGPHAEYWRLLIGQDDMRKDKKQQLLAADMQSLAERRPTTPELLYSFANHYEKLGMEQKKAHYEEKIVENHSQTVYAEWVLSSRYQAYWSEHYDQIHDNPDPQIIAEYRDLVWAYINHPFHSQQKMVGRAYRKLFKLYDEHDWAEKDQLSRIVDGLEQYDGYNIKVTHTKVAQLMAAREVDLDVARHIAREGLRKGLEKFGTPGSNTSDIEEGMGPYISGTYDALGWVFFKEGKVDSAEKYLTKAYSLDKDNRDIIYHLGKVLDRQGQNKEAEKYFIKGAKIDDVGENPNWEALKSLYVEMNGSTEGYAEYRQNINSERENRQKIKALTSWKEDPQPLRPFQLKTLDGDSVSSKELEGEIVVINMWGTWCGPCVREMPEFQKFYEKYEDDPKVEILTINSDPSAEKVRDWMDEHGYDFPVLRDDGYLRKVNIHTYPTTWFLNAEGGIAFVKTGYTGELIQKFTWRIEALKRSLQMAEDKRTK